MYKFLNNGSSQKYVILKSNSFQNVRKVSSKMYVVESIVSKFAERFLKFCKNFWLYHRDHS